MGKSTLWYKDDIKTIEVEARTVKRRFLLPPTMVHDASLSRVALHQKAALGVPLLRFHTINARGRTLQHD
jgi:hypothetical protein